MNRERNMVIVEGSCSRCGSPVQVAVGERVVRDNMVWYRSYQCQVCGNRIEEDGRGTPPEEIRNAVLKQEGEWSLVVEGSGGPAVLKALRHVLQLSVTDTAELRKRLPGEIVRGTRAEVERLVLLLDREGVQSQGVRVEDKRASAT